MMYREGHRRRRTDNGAAAVEFALVVPLLLFLLFAIISYGYMLAFRQAVSQATAEGARAAAVTPASLDDAARRSRAVAAINQALTSYAVSCTSTGVLRRDGEDAGTCVVGPPTACSGSASGVECIEVSLTYTYKDDSLLPTFPGLGVLLPETMSYKTEVEVS